MTEKTSLWHNVEAQIVSLIALVENSTAAVVDMAVMTVINNAVYKVEFSRIEQITGSKSRRTKAHI